MLQINVKENDSLEKALKKFKKKYEKTGVVKELRKRQAFEKPSVTRRMQKIKAAYKQKMQTQEMQG
ncbi:30S ribosomal protein S21 [Bacteroidia bacterium]|jgi:small subunit ribosomal protein S21|nr:30S ribosomal protein S21 [Bacteroidia bacterium]MEC8692724.1 30S ribosomal protein S21 [Bacteroidota bacterium]MDA8629527.1 30S ribosomal protein S21 [Bacteroidia bacterium]MDA9143842.1 30S ribosomal protein S21 [Bacteroidia bacterium]MDB2589282.1 30S ribosomal protein S21 [Bacteroidia bacterium]